MLDKYSELACCLIANALHIINIARLEGCTKAFVYFDVADVPQAKPNIPVGTQRFKNVLSNTVIHCN